MSTPKLQTQALSVFYGDHEAIKSVDLAVPAGQTTAFIGPSGCGKSTVLREFNRMNETIEGCRHTGTVRLDGADIHGPGVDPVELRRTVGMVFQKPNPFPLSIQANVAYGLRMAGVRDAAELQGRVEAALRAAALWDEVSSRLSAPALGLSGGQQQRLCIARALAVEPSVLLLDEPTSALDPIATARIEELMARLSGDYTLVIVTHSMQQARRCADRVAVFYLGDLVEIGPTDQIFDDPQQERSRAYVQGDFG